MAGTDLLHPPVGKGPGYEKRDVDTKRILYLFAGIVGLTLFAVAFTYYLFEHLAAREARNQPQARTLVPREANPEPPAPRLQSNPATDLKMHRREESEKADTYHWLDRSAGRVAIPVTRALQLIEARGLPVRRPQPVTPAPTAAQAEQPSPPQSAMPAPEKPQEGSR